MPIRPDVTIGYAKPKRKAVKRTRTQKRLIDVARGPTLKREPPKGSGVKRVVRVDTGDILKGKKVPPKRKPEHKSFLENVKDELEGKGVIAEVAKDVAEAVGRGATIVSTGGGPTIATRTGKRLAGKKTTGGLATVTAPKAVKAPKIVERGLKDLVNFPAQAIPSVYVPAAAAVEAARGRPQRGKKLLKDLPKTDPLAALVTGHPKRALKLAEEHPGFAALEAIGVKGAAGRGAGRVMRAAPKGSKVHRLASTSREPRSVPATTLSQPRSYSPDVTRKAVQVATERHRAKYAKRALEEARKTGEPETLAKAARLDPYRMSDNEVRKRVDQRVAVEETLRRQNRAKITHEAREAVKGQEHAGTVLRAQAIVKSDPVDWRAYRDELAAEHDALGPSAKVANRELRKQIDKAIAKNPDPVAVKAAAERYQQVRGPLQHKLAERGLLAKEQAEKAPLAGYAVRQMGAKPSEKGPVRADGEPIPAAEIRAHMKARGIDDAAYITHAPGQRGGGNFFVSSARPPQLASGVRTGAAVKKGTLEAHPDVLVEGAAKAQGLVDAADGFTRTVREFAHQPSLGKIKTKKEAQQRARDEYARTGTEWRPVRIHPFGGREEQLQSLLDNAQEAGLDEGGMQPVREALESAVRGDDGPGPWALMPEAAADQMAAHLKKLGVGPKGKALQVVGSGFRRTVLATSPTWVTGNVTEATLRAGLARAGPRSYATGRRAIKRLAELDPQAAQELSARALGGGHYGMQERQHVRIDSTQFKGGAVLEPLAKGLGAFWRQPGPKHAAAAWKGWTDIVFRQLNGKLESQFQTAMLGKALRDSPLMDGHTLKMSHEAVEQAAKGLRNTNEQATLAREVERMYGKYNAFPPDTKAMIATYTPFIAWTLNAVRFVTDVLPKDHPAATAVIASAEQVTEEWRKEHGLDLFIKERLPGFIQGSIPLSGGRHQRAPFRYTPFGAFGDPLETAAGAVLPQFSGVLSAFKGEDWKGAKLRKPDGSEADTLDKAKAAAASFVDATVPIVGVGKRVAKKGPKALNPVAPIEPAKKKTARKTFRTPDQDIDALLNTDQTQKDIDALLSP